MQKLSGNKYPWTEEEDNLLCYLVKIGGAKEWSKIAELFNQQMRMSYQRNGKQCRERWVNTLNPQLKKGKWTPEEDLVLLRKQYILGNKWREISQDMQGRSETQIKNHFKSLLKKE